MWHFWALVQLDFGKSANLETTAVILVIPTPLYPVLISGSNMTMYLNAYNYYLRIQLERPESRDNADIPRTRREAIYQGRWGD